MDILVKVCGLTTVRDAEAVADLGADMLGFIFHPPSRRNAPLELPAKVDAGRALKVGVFVKQSLSMMADIMDQAGLDLAQLHGDQPEQVCEALGPDRVIKVFWPERYDTPEALQADLDRFAPLARWFLFDAGSSGGGHGRALRNDILTRVDPPLPWLLAGGLGPETIDAALDLEPDGVDMSSGVEAEPGIKDLDKVARTIDKVRAR